MLAIHHDDAAGGEIGRESTTPAGYDLPMSAEEERLLRKWVRGWVKAGPALEKIRRQEIRKLDTKAIQTVLRQFDDVFEDALRRLPSRKTSGLVEQQAWFRRLRR